MLTSDFDYHLPDASIAQQPARRGTSRLLVVDAPKGERHCRIGELTEALHPGDLLVINDTKVFPARLFARRPGTGGKVELLLVERLARLEWTALVKPGRKARPGDRLELAPGLEVEIVGEAGDGQRRVRFSQPIEPWLGDLGHVPLPPYIKRADAPSDRESYQTVYASQEGAIAAPTAGLHFTRRLLDDLGDRGVESASLTLHIGIGTFKPVKTALVHEHRMDRERYRVPEATATALRRTRRAGGRVVAVGTTVVRALESAALAGGGSVLAGEAKTGLFIAPGFRFQVVDLLLTNFHLPRSTLLMLVCAFAGRERILTAYRQAIEHGYRFYSYGDAMLVGRAA